MGRWLEEAIQEKLERDGGRDGSQRIIAAQASNCIESEPTVSVPDTDRETAVTRVLEHGRLMRSVFIICLSVTDNIANPQLTKELYTKKRPSLWMAFSKLKAVWRECEGVEPTYPARHEA